jgi:hypothetical protein
MTEQQGNGTEPDTSQHAGAGRDDQVEALRRQVADLEDRWRRALARAHRLRAGLGLNWAALLVVTDALDRIADLERELRRTAARQAAGRPWG